MTSNDHDRPWTARRRTRLTASSVLLAACLVVTSGLPAHADYYAGGMPKTTFNVRYVAVNDQWTQHFNDSRARWNNTSGTGVSIGKTTTAAATMTASRYNESWYGLYSPSGVRGINRVFAIKINARTLSDNAGGNLTAWINSTSTHELGHALSLSDNPDTTKASLMKHSRNRTTVIEPQAYDISEVKRIY